MNRTPERRAPLADVTRARRPKPLAGGAEFRFLSPDPLVEISDKASLNMMHACPNEYILRCLGLLLPRDCAADLLRAPKTEAFAAPKCKRKTVAVKSAAACEVSDVIRSVLRRANLADDWKGTLQEVSREGDATVARVRASEPHCFCIFKHRAGQRHVTTNDKIVFVLRVPDDAPALLRQKCWSCQAQKCAKVAACDADETARARAALAAKKPEGKPGGAPEGKRACLEYADLARFALQFALVGDPPFAAAKGADP